MPLPERKLIDRIRRRAASAGLIGDDCAILSPPSGQELLVTTDFLIEGVHFRRDWHPAKAVGHRCLARGLSDIAAMGGTPLACFLSLALPRDVEQKWVDDFLKGLLALAKRHKVPLAGGDTSSSPGGVVADIVVVGAAPRGKAIRRSEAKPGNYIYVTGSLGESAATLARLASAKSRPKATQDSERHFFPEPRLKVGQMLRAKKLATAMIDLSDGLSTDISHLCEESGVGAVLDAAAIPLARGATLEQALHGGEDYELLFTASANARIPPRVAGVEVTRIGEIHRDRRQLVLLRAPDGITMPLPIRGWEHLR